MIHNVASVLGLFLLMGVAWLLSTDRRVINWRVILWGVALQLIFGIFIFILPVGSKLFLFLNDIVVKVLDSASAGTRFLFGRLALPPGATTEAGETSIGFILAFQALPTIIFFASLMGVMYYLGVMPWLISQFSKLFTRLMRVSGAESLCAASNIFVGIEAATTVRPYLDRMTRSELGTILTAGMATVASSVLALYVFILKPQFPAIAGHLISASILSAPAAIVMSKLLMPEVESPETLGVEVSPHYERESSLMEAIINGANAGVRLVVGVTALLLALLGIVALVDILLSGVGSVMNSALGMHMDWSLKGIMGYLFYPFTLIIGVPPSDAYEIAKLIGERVIATEVKSYQDLTALLSTNTLKDPRSAVIATYALTGFAHIPSLAIFIGGIAALAPGRAPDLSRIGFRALVAATLACLMTAAVAGMFYSPGSILIAK